MNLAWFKPVDKKSGTPIFLNKKNHPTRISKPAAGYLRQYLEKIRPYYARKQPRQRRLFLLNTGAAMTPGAIRQALTLYRAKAGIKKSLSPHTMRRTCATHLLSAGADIRYVQQLLGHRHLRTTQTYTKVIPVEIKQTHNQTHPGQKNLCE